MHRGSKQSYRLVRILRAAETPLSIAEITERMGRNPRNKTHCNATRQLLQRAIGRDDIQRVGPGLYGYQAKAEKPRPTFEASWGGDRRTPGALRPFDDILPKAVKLPRSGELVPDANEEFFLENKNEQDIEALYLEATGQSLFGSPEWERLVAKEMEKQRMNGHKPGKGNT